MGPTDRVIVLIDMDCFYCQVEEKLNPELEGKPIAVVQYNAWRGGGIIAVNYPARDEGVTRHMRGNEAKKKCPSIRLVQVPEVRGKADLTKYRDAGKRVADVLATCTPVLERASVDEAYLDITELVEKRIDTNLNDLTVDNLSNTFVVGCELRDFLDNVTVNREFSSDNLKLAVGGLITEEIRYEVYKKTGYKCSAGIAHNKILAKLVCSLHKPNKQTILPQDAVQKYFETVKIHKVRSLGGKFGQTLSEDFQISFMGQLAKISEKNLAQKYDEKTANWLYNIARGIDAEPVTTKLISKSIACCKNFAGITALTTQDNVEHWLGKLAEEMAERLEKDLKENNRKAKQVIVSFSQEVNRKDLSSSRTHPLVSYNPKKIAHAALEVIQKFCLRKDGSYHVKFLGLSASHFEDVKNVREITSFFQVGQANRDCQKNKPEDTNKGKCNIEVKDKVDEFTDENCDVTNYRNIYSQLTQELEENVQELIFYDDSCRIKVEDDNAFKPLHTDTVRNFSDDSSSIVIGSGGNHDIDLSFLDQDQPSTSSFFAKYFVKDKDTPTIEISESTKTEEPLESISYEDSIEKIDFQDSTVTETGEVCPECGKNIPKSELVSHQDYHFALQLSKNKRVSQQLNIKTVDSGKKKGSRKSGKRKLDASNSLMIFFKKNEFEDSPDFTETCPECNKKFRIEEISSHMDYHTAKKIHLEINTLGSTVVSKKGSSTAKINKTKRKTQNNNRNVVSFFKPL